MSAVRCFVAEMRTVDGDVSKPCFEFDNFKLKKMGAFKFIQ